MNGADADSDAEYCVSNRPPCHSDHSLPPRRLSGRRPINRNFESAPTATRQTHVRSEPTICRNREL